jgi:hypothetical protein
MLIMLSLYCIVHYTDVIGGPNPKLGQCWSKLHIHQSYMYVSKLLFEIIFLLVVVEEWKAPLTRRDAFIFIGSGP